MADSSWRGDSKAFIQVLQRQVRDAHGGARDHKHGVVVHVRQVQVPSEDGHIRSWMAWRSRGGLSQNWPVALVNVYVRDVVVDQESVHKGGYGSAGCSVSVEHGDAHRSGPKGRLRSCVLVTRRNENVSELGKGPRVPDRD